MIYLTDRVELVPHIYIHPDTFRKSERYNPAIEDRAQYFAESLAESGILNIQLLVSYEWLVPVREIHHEAIYRYLYDGLQESLSQNAGIESAFNHYDGGGLSLVDEDEYIVSSECCADFTDLESWQSAVMVQETYWQMLWNGHPWVNYRHQDGHIQLTDYVEGKSEAATIPKYTLPVAVLEAAVQQAHEELESFKERFYTFCEAQNDHRA